MTTPEQMAVKLLGPLVQEVGRWIAGKEAPGSKRPAVLSLLPNELQSEVALERLKARNALGHKLTDAEKGTLGIKPAPDGEAVELPAQQSNLKVTTGTPES
jgi:hypothetical protein